MKTFKQSEPLVTVIMTALNAADFIGEALTSLVNQTYRNLEIIVVDDGSKDGTWENILEFAATDSRIRAYRLKGNIGPSGATNFAMKKARGKYVARLDADDISYRDRIGKQVEFLEKNRSVIMLGGQCDIITEAGEPVGKKQFPQSHDDIRSALFIMNPIPHPACMFRRAVYEKAKLRYERKFHVSHDLKILYRMLKLGRFANLPDTLIEYRLRPNSITHKDPKRSFRETVEIRHWALSQGYTPTLKSFCIHILQMALVAVLPNPVITRLFHFWRIRSFVSSIPAFIGRATRLAVRFVPAMIAFLLLPKTE
ncbi:hypothetical protein A2Z33_01955 [Candidatus Gottesmanbacteria bacterium RBG_16_52_11]|uniref:Glycosyltransferase 2-like domain-containing protein n=1 Tax=Candidatus Gottesmanbacteria bacterium RBG_16_52_11 TaxID=1798374 RepID=A0A1F5YQR5_9BACT|nr:MAG: hypothetical protein A2Z33_01955 [Candidatus Gottesmanbacteria bacterium RBG_16_52_11]